MPTSTKLNIKTKMFEMVLSELYNPRLTISEKETIMDWYNYEFNYKKEILNNVFEDVKFFGEKTIFNKDEFEEKEYSEDNVDYGLMAKECIWDISRNARVRYYRVYMTIINPIERSKGKYVWRFSISEILSLFEKTEDIDDRKMLYIIIDKYTNWIISKNIYNIKNNLHKLDKSKIINR